MDCPYCKSSDTLSFFKSRQPSILSACPKEKLPDVKVYPIEVRLCRSCGLGYNAARLDDATMKSIYDNYLYISPSHNIGLSIYDSILEFLQEFCTKSDRIVEIGCSEAIVLQQLKKQDFSHLTGIEPGPQAEIARAAGLSIIHGYFEESTISPGSVDVFLLVHVFEHFSDPFAMLDVMKSRLARNGRIIIIVPDFTGYHHQHFFYYNAFFFRRLCQDKGLIIESMISTGPELRCVLRADPVGTSPKQPQVELSLADITERALRIQEESVGKIRKIEGLLTQYTGKTVYWWGAGSASTILLNQVSEALLKGTEIIIIDSDHARTGYYIPGTGLTVHHPDSIRGTTPYLMIIGSSLFAEIKTRMEEYAIRPKKVEVIY